MKNISVREDSSDEFSSLFNSSLIELNNHRFIPLSFITGQILHKSAKAFYNLIYASVGSAAAGLGGRRADLLSPLIGLPVSG